MNTTKRKLEQQLLKPLTRSEPVIERMFFNNRPFWVLLFLMATLFLGYQASKLRLDASFEKMIPTFHPYIANYLDNKSDLSGLGNSIRVSVENTQGSIFTAEFQEVLKNVNDEVFFINGVNRAEMKSIWTSNVRWTEVTEEGFAGGPVIPDGYDGSQASMNRLRGNIFKSGQVGTLVANDFRSAIIFVPLFDRDPQTGKPLDYQKFSEELETLIREKHETADIKIHITGFAKVVGDLIDGAAQVAIFFALALVITLVMLFLYSRCLRSTLIAVFCSLIAVVWQLGLLRTLGYGLDPYSMLIPFLIFAIGVSHGVQIINAVGQEVQHGADSQQSARRAFRALYIPGLTALLSDGIGFVTLIVIEIEVIQDLAIAASIGVAVIILTNLVLLPILISYSGTRVKRNKTEPRYPLWRTLSNFTKPRVAVFTVLIAAGLFGFGFYASQGLKIGDMDAGAPELRPDSRYNLDNAFITENYSTSTDIFVVMVKTTSGSCISYPVFSAIDRFQWEMQHVPGVQSTSSLVNTAKRASAGMNEGNLKWMSVNRSQLMLNASVTHAPAGQMNADCSLIPVLLYLNDHKAETLQGVVSAVEKFAAKYNNDDMQFVLAAGNAGIEAATNIVIGKAQYEMLAWVYGVVAFLCLLTFRSLRTVICIIIPLALTSVLCQALMTYIGIGVKVATLPVIALGVGIGVDYGIYIYSKLQTYLLRGQSLTEAYFNTLKTTGKAVAFTGLTLAIGVGTWSLSPIKFQADMGILLTFMFLWNMLGALILLPAMAKLLVKVPAKAPTAGTKDTAPLRHLRSETSNAIN